MTLIDEKIENDYISEDTIKKKIYQELQSKMVENDHLQNCKIKSKFS